jgi:hypothetical protein
MEYFLGALITFAAIVITKMTVTKDFQSVSKIKVSYSQTDVFELIRPFIPAKFVREPEKTQSIKHYDSLFSKILFDESNAYWIKDNTFYTAEVVDGEVDRETSQPVDIMSMDKVQLDKMIFIIETLTKGNFDDYRNSR